jgi:hypothetical protein
MEGMKNFVVGPKVSLPPPLPSSISNIFDDHASPLSIQNLPVTRVVEQLMELKTTKVCTIIQLYYSYQLD